MFESPIYKSRRRALLERMHRQGAQGLVLFLGNDDAAMNYAGNSYEFRQDSSFLYFWGLSEPGMAASLDLSDGSECIYADNGGIDDVIWTGPQPTVAEKALSAGVNRSASRSDFGKKVRESVRKGIPVHFLPSGRHFNRLEMSELTGTPPSEVFKVDSCGKNGLHASLELVNAVIALRLVKEDCEIEQIDLACDLGVRMHDIARRRCIPGTPEKDIVGEMDGFTLAKGWGVSFPTILSQNGQILHGHDHSGIITPGRLLLVDAGLVLDNCYCSDFTRTLPCSGKFTPMQREIYDIVEGCNALAYSMAAPGVAYRDVHLAVCRHMLAGLKNLGLLRGDVDEMNSLGIAGMFMPHGLGHNIGLDVHDMEDLGEDRVGYDPDQKRSDQLGLGSLRMARRLVPGNVVSDEPGIYFIPALWDWFRSKGLDKGFVNFDALRKYSDFGGIRLEDDLLITAEGCRRLGHLHLPIKSYEVENDMASRA